MVDFDMVVALLGLVHEVKSIEARLGERLVEVDVDVVAYITRIEGDGVGLEQRKSLLVHENVVEEVRVGFLVLGLVVVQGGVLGEGDFRDDVEEMAGIADGVVALDKRQGGVASHADDVAVLH